MIVSGSVLSNEYLILPSVNVTEVGTSNSTTTNSEGKYSINVASANSTLRFSHAAYDYDEAKAGEINNQIMFLYPASLDPVDVTGNKPKSDNTLLWVVGIFTAAVIGAIALNGKSNKPKLVNP